MAESKIKPLSRLEQKITLVLKNENIVTKLILGLSIALDDVDIMSITSLETPLFWG